jgi:hypothetical protein
MIIIFELFKDQAIIESKTQSLQVPISGSKQYHSVQLYTLQYP